MVEEDKTAICARCKTELHGQFCSKCGHSRELKRIDGNYILSEIGNELNFEKGVLFTIKELLIRPGLNIQKFILEDRNRLVRPIIFLIITSLVYTVAQQALHFEDEYAKASFSQQSFITIVFEWIQQNYGYSNILMSIFIAMWIKVFFKKYGYNFFEILIMLCFIMGIGMLIYTFFGIVESLTHFKVLHTGGLLGFVYAAWAIGKFFEGKPLNYFKGLTGYLLGAITFFSFAFGLGAMIDFVLK